MKNDLIEDLNTSPKSTILNPPSEMINFKNLPIAHNKQMFFEDSINSAKKKGFIPNNATNVTHENKDENLNNQGNENEVIMENKKLYEKIGVLEKKVMDLENYCLSIENKNKDENTLNLQIKEKVRFFKSRLRFNILKGS